LLDQIQDLRQLLLVVDIAGPHVNLRGGRSPLGSSLRRGSLLGGSLFLGGSFRERRRRARLLERVVSDVERRVLSHVRADHCQTNCSVRRS
jgi:hypothetical protein